VKFFFLIFISYINPLSSEILDFKLSPVLNVIFFILGDFPASEFYVSTFRNTVSSIFIGGVRRKIS